MSQVTDESNISPLHQRTTRWFSAAEAAALVTDDGLRPLILQLEQRRAHPGGNPRVPAESDRRGCGSLRQHESSAFEYNAEDGAPRVGEYIASRSAIVCDEAAIAHALHRRRQGSAGRIIDAGRRAEQRDAF